MMPPKINKTPRQVSAHRDDRGVSLVEYALLLALVAVVSIGAMGTLGTNVHDEITYVNKLGFAGGGSIPCVPILPSGLPNGNFPGCLLQAGGGF
jgi:Flp pilus assembly pilin Flp